MNPLLQHIFGQVTVRQWIIHLSLFFLTFFSTTLAGLELTTKNGLSGFIEALSYSLPLMIILTGHELGHYVMARLYGVSVSLPYFIPMPLISPFGTMGAFIRMYGLPVDRRSLFDIAFWGPAMSFLLSIPFLVIGISLSEVNPIPQNFQGMVFGDSLLVKFVTALFYNIPPGYDIVIHPMGFAGWTGLFITALNLLPVGQLDGGHIAYAVFGKRQKEIGYVVLVLLFLFSLEFTGWFFLGLILIFLGIRHPPLPTEYFGEIRILDPRRRKLAWFSMGIFLLCFVPVPVQNYSWQRENFIIEEEQNFDREEDFPYDSPECGKDCEDDGENYKIFYREPKKPSLGV